MEKVLVLMSTYNGERFLEEQLATIFAQEGVSVSVLVRDDGSTDGTCRMLETWKRTHCLDYICGDNVGAARSFFLLLQQAPASTYYAFADQDDVWFAQKLRRAVDCIACQQTSAADGTGSQQPPCLYFANVDLTDAQGGFKQRSLPDTLHLTKQNALIESFASGCTMVFNDALRQTVCRHIPDENVYHDRWLYLTAMFLGTVVYDGTPVMGYRQHGANQVGTRTAQEKGSLLSRLLKPGDFPMADTAALFYRYYHQELTDADRHIVQVCMQYKSSLLSKLKLVFYPAYRLAADGWARSIYWKLRILLNRL